MICNKCDNNRRPNLPASICPVPPAEDCPVTSLLTGCLGLFVVGALCVWALLAILPDKPPPRATTAEKEENPYPQFPLFSVHWELCPKCRAPLINEKGEESGGFCEMGFKLLQEDMRHSKQ